LDRSSKTVLDVHPVSSLKESDSMTRPTVVTYEPTLPQLPAVTPQPLLNPANDDFDVALEHVAASLSPRRGKPTRHREADRESQRESSENSLDSTLIGTGAIAAAAHRFVLRPPDDLKHRSAWCSRFPRS
jgi:hypothetical protein